MADQERKYTYKLIDPDEIEQIKATEYLVQDLFVLGEITFVWGTPKHFKTFFVLDALLCVAMGISFFGRKVQQRKVLYMIGEDSDAIARNFDQSPARRKEGFAAVFTHDDFARNHLRDKGDVLWVHPEFAGYARQCNHLDILGVHAAFRGDYFKS